MNQFTSAQNLNRVLNLLATSPFARPVISDTDLLKELKRMSIKIEARELLIILNTFVEKNYVKREGRTMFIKGATTYIMYYSINAEGLAFNKNGGFSENEISFQYQPSSKEQIKNMQLQSDKTIAVETASKPLFLEKAAWIAAILGILFLAAQLFKIWPFDN